MDMPRLESTISIGNVGDGPTLDLLRAFVESADRAGFPSDSVARVDSSRGNQFEKPIWSITLARLL